MRSVLEGAAAQFAARAASDVELNELQAIHQAMSEATSVKDRYELNQQFHAALLDSARNRFMVKAVGAVNKTLLILGPSRMEKQGRAVSAVSEHGAFLAALRARPPKMPVLRCAPILKPHIRRGCVSFANNAAI